MAKNYKKILKHLVCIIYYFILTILYSFVPLKWRPKKDVSNELVLITGGANGIGRWLALRFAKLGSKIVIWDIDDVGSQETVRQVREVGGIISSYHCDVANRDEVYTQAKRVKEQVGKVTILINNAGIVIGKTLLDLEDDGIERVFQVNTLANFWTVKAFLPDMMESNHGHIVSLSSISGNFGCDLFIDYSSSKHALNGFDECLKLELIRRGLDGVHTTLICPFLIRGGFFDGFYDGVVNILEPDYSMDEIMLAILTNTEVMYLPKLLYIITFLRPVISRRVLYHLQNILADRNMADTVKVRPFKVEKKE